MKMVALLVGGAAAVLGGLYWVARRVPDAPAVTVTRPGDTGPRNQDGEPQYESPVTNAIVNAWSNLVTYTVRGLRNNNPGNIRISGNNWRGKVPAADNTDGAFEQFYNAPDGIRALARNLYSYYNRGLRTIDQIITTWAPTSENNTTAYIAQVVAATGVPADAQFPPDKVPALVATIIKHENGQQPYAQKVIEDAARSAGWAIS